MSLELGDKTRGLKFNIGTLKCLEEVAGIDPLEFKAESDKLSDLLPYGEKILHAALLSNCLSKKEAADFTAEDVAQWLNELDIPTVTEIITLYNGIFRTPTQATNGEVGKDTQPAIV